MGCRGCGDKANRQMGVKGDLDARPPAPDTVTSNVNQGSFVGKGFKEMPTADPQVPPMNDPISALVAAQKMSYEELTARRTMQQRMIKSQGDAILAEMTDAMKRVHVDELIGVANADLLALPGMTPAQAVIALRDVLSRDDFAFVEDLYPGLNEAVNKRYEKLRAERLPGPDNT